MDHDKDKARSRERAGVEGQRDSNPGDPTLNDATASNVPTDPPPTASGLQASGEFRIGEKLILGMRGGDILLRHSPQGDEVTISEQTVAAVLIDAFFNPQSKDYQKNIARDD